MGLIVSGILCVSGMHRSGTSLTMGWLERCGLVVDDGRRLAVTAGNPKGHYEDAEIALIQHQAILQAYPKSKGWQVMDRQAPAKLELPALAQNLVETRNRQYALWGWKDPRTVHFLGAWKDLIPDLKALLVWRPCAQVVASLERRANQAGQGSEGFLHITAHEAEQLWLTSNQHMLDYMRKHPEDSILVSLDELIQNGKQLIALINERFTMNLEDRAVTDVFDQQLLQGSAGDAFQAENPAAVAQVTASLVSRSAELSHDS